MTFAQGEKPQQQKTPFADEVKKRTAALAFCGCTQDKDRSWLNTYSVPCPAQAFPSLWGGSKESPKVSLKRTEVQSMKEAAGGAETQWNPVAEKSMSPASINRDGNFVGLQLMWNERWLLPDNHPPWINHGKASSGERHAGLQHLEFYASPYNCLARWGQHQLTMAVLDRNSQSSRWSGKQIPVINFPVDSGFVVFFPLIN